MSHSDHARSLSPDALERLLAARQKFLSFVEKRVGSKADAEDILQAAFVRGIERGGLRDDESVVQRRRRKPVRPAVSVECGCRRSDA
jgi:DNA-directed RNA polymerase specialized sigma24 family protein